MDRGAGVWNEEGTLIVQKMVLGFAVMALVAAAEPISGVVESRDGRVGDDYVPAMLSNGRLCVFCDYTLSVPREEPRYEKKKLRPGIRWEGRRYGDNSGKASRFGYQFFPQGRLATRLVVDGAVQKVPVSWRQRLTSARPRPPFPLRMAAACGSTARCSCRARAT